MGGGTGGREEAVTPFGLNLRSAQLGYLMESFKTRRQDNVEGGGVTSLSHWGTKKCLPLAKPEIGRGGLGCWVIRHWACGEHLPQSFAELPSEPHTSSFLSSPLFSPGTVPYAEVVIMGIELSPTTSGDTSPPPLLAPRAGGLHYLLAPHPC